MEVTISSTALPSVIADLGGGDLYIWPVDGCLLATTSLQPLFGQLANIFGRRWPLIIATAAFVLGSGICGGATNISMLIAGRIIQGAGAGGINVLVEIVVCDLVPLREKGNYMAAIFGVVALSTALGPLFSGLIVQNISWRWVFYIILHHSAHDTLATSMGRVDWAGNALFIASISSVLIALSWTGVVYPWSSYCVIIPLVVGMGGLVGFMFFEGSKYALQPTMPLHLMSNRTSATAYVLTFVHSIVTMWALYFLPVYFRGVLGSSPSYSGVQLLPTILIIVPFAAAGGAFVSKTGRYRPIHHGGFALMIVGFGLFTLLDADSSTGAWVGFQIINAFAGFGRFSSA
ncbi:Major Facilitator Superfamily protein [Pleurostoma richardsiae]|uniref:Major Facilitator Superfamily protein n=1 Tax=Pleurostoma richardsiae TaxID=41990 RepID=A0AA38VPB9_9PEZI|nr:Major Facilitator Superfamily protein [Pleurostoma richardsiae]